MYTFQERPRRRWEDNIRMDFNDRGINTRNLVDSAQDRVGRRIQLFDDLRNRRYWEQKEEAEDRKR